MPFPFSGKRTLRTSQTLFNAPLIGHTAADSADQQRYDLSAPGKGEAADHMPGAWARLFCCGGRAGRPKREHSRRRHRRKHAHTHAVPSRIPTQRNELGGVAASVVSESEYHDAREVFGDGAHLLSTSTQLCAELVQQSCCMYEPGTPLCHSCIDRWMSGSNAYGDTEYLSTQVHDDAYHEAGSESGSFSGSESGSAVSESSGGFGARIVSCLSIMRASSPGETNQLPEGQYPPGGAPKPWRPLVGCTFPRRDVAVDPGVAELCWDECESSNFQVRSQDYMRSKLKQASSKAIYRLVGMDLFSTDTKAYHVAKQFALPATGPPVMCKSASGSGPDVALPPLLIMNVQLPDYPAAFWGANDGPGQSIVYYLQLRDDFDPDTFENKAALGLLQRFVTNGREVDGSPTRDRLKMIVRVANLEEWARVAPLHTTEYKLLQNYNEKPVLTKPQQMFYVGPNYLEVDLDVHSYAFLARKALWGYHDRIATLVWDNGFVIQGNSSDELPEQLLGCGRIYRSDFRHFPGVADTSAQAVGSLSATPSRSGSVLQSPCGSSPAAAAAVSRGDAAGAADAAVLLRLLPCSMFVASEAKWLAWPLGREWIDDVMMAVPVARGW
ncbi:hypothetical protein COO60DRAFT_1623849 [Scenedesmus sp. NREL 46B-D3]|nr:hypothetical protein COO60DRAFT_1623849 [Scenedesmus sp. NREL 46B-D3]